jgi:erythronate-4-phosphate dehydrogenase
MLNIVADSAIPFAERFFSHIGELNLLHAEEINSETLVDADVLVCRTVTLVNQHLLENSNIKVVASPTSGVDHVDLDYLLNQSIHFACAPGSNARSVAEYVVSALCILADQKGFDLSAKTVGIIGCGNVGSLLQEFIQAMGIECLVYDPFLQNGSSDGSFCELEDIKQADIISLHVPLTKTGPYPTIGMLDEQFFQTMNKDVILINTARGGVVDEAALKTHLQGNDATMIVIDVWENEPAIDVELLLRTDIATPHIAGYSIDSKLRATKTIFEKVCEHLQLDSHFDDLQAVFPVEEAHEISLNEYENELDALSMAVLASYDVRSDAAAIRRMLEDNVSDRASYFSELRNNYPIRREFSSLTINLLKDADSLRQKLLRLGFHIQ